MLGLCSSGVWRSGFFRSQFEGLFGAACRVKRNADEHQHNGKHDDGDKGFHGYSLPKVRAATPMRAKTSVTVLAAVPAEVNQPSKLMSVIAMMPCQYFR